MALDMTLEGRFSITETSEAIRDVLPDVSEGSEEAPRSGLILAAPSIWISIGSRTRPRKAPDATIEPTSFVCFRLDKFALLESRTRALRCVCAILDATDGDCVLMSLDIPILARISGDVRLYKYGREPSFWEHGGAHELLTVPTRMVQTERRPWEEDDEPPDTHMILEGLFSSPAKVRDAIRSVLATADEEVGDPLSFHFRLSTPLVEATIGPGDLPVEAPDATVESSCGVMFALNQDDLMDAEVLALECVNAILEATDEDCGLLLIEQAILARVAGDVRLYRYGTESEFWDLGSMRELIRVPARVVEARQRPRESS